MMATVARDFSYFDRTFEKGDEVPNDDPIVALAPQYFEAAKPAKSTKKERP